MKGKRIMLCHAMRILLAVLRGLSNTFAGSVEALASTTFSMNGFFSGVVLPCTVRALTSSFEEDSGALKFRREREGSIDVASVLSLIAEMDILSCSELPSGVSMPV